MKKIINNILHRFKEDSLAKHTESGNRVVEYKGAKEIKQILVFWTADAERQDYFKRLTTLLPGAKQSKLCFVPSGVEILETDDMVTLRNEELGFGGKIQNERLHKMLAQKYDLLVDLTPTSNGLINYVLNNTQAHCIIGRKKEGGIADIVIDGSDEPVEFINKMVELLAEINRY